MQHNSKIWLPIDYGLKVIVLYHHLLMFKSVMVCTPHSCWVWWKAAKLSFTGDDKQRSGWSGDLGQRFWVVFFPGFKTLLLIACIGFLLNRAKMTNRDQVGSDGDDEWQHSSSKLDLLWKPQIVLILEYNNKGAWTIWHIAPGVIELWNSNDRWSSNVE
jgi:hypothetical protein